MSQWKNSKNEVIWSDEQVDHFSGCVLNRNNVGVMVEVTSNQDRDDQSMDMGTEKEG